jgi:hypothetical protein
LEGLVQKLVRTKGSLHKCSIESYTDNSASKLSSEQPLAPSKLEIAMSANTPQGTAAPVPHASDDAHGDGCDYSSGDIEGQVWTYDALKPRPAAASRGLVEPGDRLRRMTIAIALLIASATAVLMLGRVLGISGVRDLGLRLDASATVGEEVVGKQPETFSGERPAASRDFSAAGDHLARQRDVREVVLAVVSDTEHLANGPGGTRTKEGIELELEDTIQRLARERSAREEALRGAKEAREHSSLAERANENMQEQLVAEQTARLRAEVAAQQTKQQLAKEHGTKEAAERALKKAQHVRARHVATRTSIDERSLLLLASPN